MQKEQMSAVECILNLRKVLDLYFGSTLVQ